MHKHLDIAMSLSNNNTIEVLTIQKKASKTNLIEISNWVNVAINAKKGTPKKNQPTGRLLQVNMSLCKMVLNKKS